MKTNKESEVIAIAIREWLGVYLPKMRSCSQNTLTAYNKAVKLYMDFLEQVKSTNHTSLCAKNFSFDTIQEWIVWLKTIRGCSNSTCNHRLSCIRSFLKYLAHKDPRFMEQEVKASEIKYMSVPRNEFQEVTQKAMKALFAAPNLSTSIGKRDFALFNLMYITGARINEVLSLRIRDLHLYEGHGRNYVVLLGKGTKIRTIYLLPEIVKIMKSYIKQFHGTSPDDDNMVFFSRNGGQKQKLTQEAVNKRLKKYACVAHSKCPEIPKDLHCHSLRSARATHWLEQGLNIVMIQKLLGHEDIKTTMKYVGISVAQKEKALEALEDDVAKSATKKWKDKKMEVSLAEILGLK